MVGLLKNPLQYIYVYIPIYICIHTYRLKTFTKCLGTRSLRCCTHLPARVPRMSVTCIYSIYLINKKLIIIKK